MKRKSWLRIILIGLPVLAGLFLLGWNTVRGAATNASLLVKSSGQPFVVYLNSQLKGQAPVELATLKPGSYAVELKALDPELASYTTLINLHPKTTSVIDWRFGSSQADHAGIKLELERILGDDQARIIVQSVPDISIVKLDGKSLGLTPVAQSDLTAGEYWLEVSSPGYLSTKHSIQLIDGYTLRATVTLPREPINSSPSGESPQPLIESLPIEATPEVELGATPAASRREQLLGKPSVTPAPKGQLMVKSTPTGTLRVRLEPTTASEEIATVMVGDRLPYFLQQAGWYQVEYQTGVVGWVSGQYVEIVE